MKRVLSLVLALSMVLGMFSFAFAGSNLKDIVGTDYEASVEALIELGVVNGYTDGTFQPEKVVTRAEMAKLLVVSAGLEPAADVAKGATRFSDVAGSHWASGYVNVAAEYGYIVGYPDGTFAPDKTVTYAEAVTMALRVLGYRTVVESKGTWPTNYIAKAGDLKMLEDITYGSYSDGAKRGNVAKLIWNMLRTRMWDVTGESEGNGLEYSKAQIMLDVKFPDYTYDTVEFESFSIKDGDVTIKLIGDKTKYAYEGTDFYTFVKGTEVEVLLNEKDETILTIVPTDRDALVDGTPADLEDDDYEGLEDYEDADYVYAMVDGDTVSGDATVLTVKSEYVYKVRESSSGVTVNTNTTVKEKDFDKKVVLKDGERISYGDIAVGDVLSTVKVGTQEFYVVSNQTVEGEFTKYVIADATLTIDGEEYTEAPAEYVVNPEKDGNKAGKTLSSASANDRKDMKGEDVVAYLDFLGRVVRIDFDGELDDDDDSTDVHFYMLATEVDRYGRDYVVDLENEDGEKSGAVIESSLGKALFNSTLKGYFAVVGFDDDGEIVSLAPIARPIGDDSGEIADLTDADLLKALVYDEDEADGKYEIKVINGARFDEDNNKLSGDVVVDVDEDTLVVTLSFDEGASKKKTTDDKYEVAYGEGPDEVKKIKDEVVLAIYDLADDFKTAKYVVRFTDASNDDLVIAGKVKTSVKDDLDDGRYALELEYAADTDYTYRDKDNTLAAGAIVGYKNGLVLFTLKDVDGEDFMVVRAAKTSSELKAFSGDASVKVVKAVNSSKVMFSGDTDATAINDTYRDNHDDYVFVTIELDFDTTDADKIIVSVDEPVVAADVEASMFEKGDGVLEDTATKVVYIIKDLVEIDD